MEQQKIGLDNMTIYDYHMVMISVNIAMLKAKLSAYLSQVKLGQELMVFDRNTPIAKVVPLASAEKPLTIIKATKNPADLKKMKIRPVKKKFDVVQMLMEERERR